ncbi:hypothetical protein [Sphingobium nicotianae]|uniref:Preprotein translocase subunit YajC n=1 Tax=Sphingobium nicotianae TaxID=2782607 RepID=A0A9X1DBQ9_9SPHN|nr:hypothetical protein [Sphingobium nicotianae]MBT2186935.1 hypothetical protein [Sphingobium nicotianae]
MMRAASLPSLGLLALALLATPFVPLRAQSGGLLGDSGVSSSGQGSGGEASPASQGERRDRRTRGSQSGKRHVEISPYLEVDQTAIWDLKGGNGDTLTYTTVSAGVTASIETQSVSVGADVRYAHEFAWNRGQASNDIISGIVNARADVVANMLSVEGGALATRVRSDGFTGGNNSLAGVNNTSNAYSFYVGPNLSAPIGDLTVTGAYRLGYNRVDNGSGAVVGPAGTFDSSWINTINLSVGMQPGPLAFGWSVGGGYVRETSKQLSQRFEDKFVRADVTVPVSFTVALVGGVGYEKIQISSKDALRDANGVPLVNGNGGFITDPASPRRLSYDQDGLIWDAGVMWRPSPRLQAEARIGHRYGSMSYTGSLTWQPNGRTSIGAALFDSVDSFGRSMNGGLANLGTDFTIGRNPFSGDLTGCAFSSGGANGVCINDMLTGISAANFRSRGVVAQFAHRSDMWGYWFGAGYTQRKFLSGGVSVLASVDGQTDENYFASAGLNRQLGADSAIDAMAYWNYFSSVANGVGNVTNIGANLSYRRNLMRRLQLSGAVGIDSLDRKGHEAFVSLLAQIGLRYQF